MNIEEFRYVPFLKTQPAELMAIQKLNDRYKNQLRPFVVLTRSRSMGNSYLGRHPEAVDGDIQRSLQKWGDSFIAECPFFLDLSAEASCRNEQFEQLLSPNNGYANWCQFIQGQRSTFPNIIPVIQINDLEDQSGGDNKQRQITTLLQGCNYIAYREEILASSDSAEDFAGYIGEICEMVAQTHELEHLFVVLDAGYLYPERSHQASSKINDILRHLLARYPGLRNIIVTSSSFPLSLSDFVEDQKAVEYEGMLQSESIPLFLNIYSTFREQLNIIYGDYAFIHPVKNSASAGARGWIPRIDISTGSYLRFWRHRRQENDYKEVYQLVAYDVVSSSEFFFLPNCWGKSEILNASWGRVEKVIPQFWVAVRANIHLSSILKLDENNQLYLPDTI